MYSHTAHSGPRSWDSTKVDSNPQYAEVYFSYSSNLSPQTMKGRHPHSLFAGLAVLKGWRWNVNSLQFGNIVPASDGDVVYGALYFITPQDEAGLDDMEGAPAFYQKKHLEVTRINADGSETDQKVEALIYIDVERPNEGVMAQDYVVWIRKLKSEDTVPLQLLLEIQGDADFSLDVLGKAIRDAKPYGLPDDYVEKSIRPYLPTNEADEVEQDMEPVRLMFSKNAFQ